MKQKEAHPTPAGPRMSGIDSGPGGLRLEFRPVAVILDCGDAHAISSYSVKMSSDQLLMSIANGTSPLSLTLRQDGTLAGSGSAQVAGRLITGKDDNGLIYTPTVKSCPVGTLSPQT